jgi:flagellar hook protein FlgE
MLDTISNNVSNVNTIGFKAGRVMFKDMLSQTLSAGSGSDSTNNLGGTNPIQTGTGVALASIDTIQTQGAMQATGISTDCAVQGDGFFITQTGTSRTYTRAGMFRFDSTGNLVDPNGALVQGWQAQAQVGNPLAPLTIDSSNPTAIGNIQVNAGMTLKPLETSSVELVGNLDAGATAANLVSSATEPGVEQITVTAGCGTGEVTTTYNVGYTDMQMPVYDSLGNQHLLNVHMRNLSGTMIPSSAVEVPDGAPLTYDNNTWAWSVDTDANDATVALLPDNSVYTDPITGDVVRCSSSGVMHFTTNGALDWVSYGDRNMEHFFQGGAGTFDAWVSQDPMNQMAVGFEGATIPSGDFNGDATAAAAGTFDNPQLAYMDGSGIPTNPLLPNPPSTFDLTKLPIVLAFQNVPAGTPIPPTSTTAGRLASVDIANVNGILESRNGAGLGDPTAVQNWFVQAINIDWGTVSTVTNADFDRSYAVYDNTLAPNPDQTAQVTQDNLGNIYEDGIADSQSTPPPGGPVNMGPMPPVITYQYNVGQDDPNGLDFGWDPRVKSLNDGRRDGLTQDSTGVWSGTVYTPKFSAYMRTQDGYAEGILQSVAIDSNGIINGGFTNGKFQQLAQIAVARFENPGGMAKSGATGFVPTSNSGTAVIGTANTNGRGSVVGGALEQSNVDLSKELTDMIVAQRGFEVNARLVTTSDRILDTLVNLGR